MVARTLAKAIASWPEADLADLLNLIANELNKRHQSRSKAGKQSSQVDARSTQRKKSGHA
jgi:hypothetical protein